MPNPLDQLNSLQRALDNGTLNGGVELASDYRMFYDQPNGRVRFLFPKIINGEIRALAMFIQVDPIHRNTCFDVSYAVIENHRGKNLAVEAVETGINQLKGNANQNAIKRFYVQAVIEETNSHSLTVAKKLFPNRGTVMTDRLTGTPSFYFLREIAV